MDFLDNVSNWPSIIKIGFDISLKYTIVWLVKDKEPRKHYHKKAGSIYDELSRDGTGFPNIDTNFKVHIFHFRCNSSG